MDLSACVSLGYSLYLSVSFISGLVDGPIRALSDFGDHVENIRRVALVYFNVGSYDSV